MNDQETTESTPVEAGTPTVASLQKQIVAERNRASKAAERYERSVNRQRDIITRLTNENQRLKSENAEMKRRGLQFQPERGKW